MPRNALSAILGATLAVLSCAAGGDAESAPKERQLSSSPTRVGPAPASRNTRDGRSMAFERRAEPVEQAFDLLVPRGWTVEGGIFRVNAVQAGGPLNAIEAKCDLRLKSDPEGSVMFRVLPDIVHAHAGIGGGFFPPGSNYQGAMVRPLETAAEHLRGLFEQLHPGATDVEFRSLRQLPGEIEALERANAYTNSLLARLGSARMAFRHDAAGAIVDYTENGRRFREVLLTAVVDMPAALTWKNTRTLQFRAPLESFDAWRPAMDVIRFSIRFRPRWILAEARGQKERADFVQDVFDTVRRIDREILQRTQITREEIMNDNFLVLTGQEEFVNPHTGEVELDTDAFAFRWTTPGGDVFYTDREEDDPNTFLQRTDYRRTPVRPRRNE